MRLRAMRFRGQSYHSLVKKLASVIGMVLGLGFLAWLAWAFPLATWQESLSLLPPSTLALALLALLLTYVLRAWRLTLEFSAFSLLSLARALRIVVLHNAMLNVMPFRSGELAFPWLLKRVAAVPLLRATGSLLWLRFQDACVVALLGIWVWPMDTMGWRLVLTLGLVMGVLFAHFMLRSEWSFLRTATQGWRAKLAALQEGLRHGQQQWLGSWLITLANWVLKLSVQAALLVLLLDIAWSLGYSGILGAELSAFLPIQGVAGLGTFEAGTALALGMHGVEWKPALQAAALVHAVMLLNSLLWALLVGQPWRPLQTVEDRPA